MSDTCKPIIKGEIVPLIVEITTETETRFEIIDDITKTYCEVRSSSGDIVSILPALIQVRSDTKKDLYSSWDTKSLEAGYYVIKFWVGINLFGVEDGLGNLVVDYRLASEEINRYVKLE